MKIKFFIKITHGLLNTKNNNVKVVLPKKELSKFELMFCTIYKSWNFYALPKKLLPKRLSFATVCYTKIKHLFWLIYRSLLNYRKNYGMLVRFLYKSSLSYNRNLQNSLSEMMKIFIYNNVYNRTNRIPGLEGVSACYLFSTARTELRNNS